MNGRTRALRLGRIFGIQIAVDASWLFIAVLMTWNLAVAFSRWHPDWGAGVAIGIAALASALFFASVVLHELAHSLVAKAYGVPVSGITLFLFGGVSNIEREPPSARAELLMAIVGPLTSIAIGVLLLLLASFVVTVGGLAGADPRPVLERLGPAETLLVWLGPINVLVGLFNLIPGFPLDGGRMLRAVLWAATGDLHRATRWASAVGQTIGWGFVFVGVAMAFGARVPMFGTGVLSGLWLAFIGWFLASAAATMWRRQLLHEMLEGLRVEHLMRRAGRTVRRDVHLASLVGEWVQRSDEGAFVVVDDGSRFVGLVTLADMRRVARDRWTDVRIEEVMTPRERLVTTTRGESAADALDKMVRADVSQLPVVESPEGDALAGMLLRRDVSRWLELHAPPREPHAQRYAQ